MKLRNAWVIVLLSLPLITGFKISTDAISAGKDAFKAATLSDKDAIELGRKTIKQMDANNQVAPASNPYAKRLAKLTAKHAKGNLNFKVYINDTVNAFATPDGSIRFYTGIMDLMNDQELLSVIGHEIGHVELKHSLKKMKKAYATSAARKGVAASGGGAGVLAASQLGALGEALINSKFSRSEETAADDFGLTFMKENGYDPAAMVNAFRKLAAISTKGTLLSSHPDPQKRAKRVEGKL